jgi:hypothetical protein
MLVRKVAALERRLSEFSADEFTWKIGVVGTSFELGFAPG